MSSFLRPTLRLGAAVALSAACGNSHATTDAGPSPVYGAHSSAIAITRDGARLLVANADADSVSVIDLAQRSLAKEVLLAPAHPAPDGTTGAFAPAVMPRSLALSPDEKLVYVSGERSGRLHVIDVASGSVTAAVPVCSEPVGVVVSRDGGSVYVACSQDDAVVRVDAATLAVNGTLKVPSEPWALAWDGVALLATSFLTAAVTAIDPVAMTVATTVKLPDIAPRGDKRLAHGQPRGLYDAQLRPGTAELWIAYSLLGTDTAQPELDFESTAFPALAIVLGDGTYQQSLSTDAQDVPGVDGAFGDIVSGPHALAFTQDGRFALMVDSASEDVLVVDAEAHVESSLLRPLPGHQPEAIAVSSDERFAYVYERNTNDVAVLAMDRSSGALKLRVDSSTRASIPTLGADPMPQTMRLGQHLFNTANSDEVPISTNHWVACATCHMEGRSDAVTWLFEQGPRDTPTNAGGMLGTGFLFRTADRNKVQDYWRTINIEQGGAFDPNDPSLSALLDAITAYVNLGIPLPIPPTTNPELVAKGGAIFQARGCASCHSGPRYTDSGQGNASLDLAGPVLLHDVNTCATQGFPDVTHEDIEGHARAACAFDTPSLSGVASSPPYMHDGRDATLSDAVRRMISVSPDVTPLSADDEAALVEFLRSL